MTTPTPLEFASPAKINVFLEVHGKRDDGFHELETVMLRTDLSDVMRFESAPDDVVELQLCDGASPQVRENFPLDDSNLIMRAANALREISGQQHGAVITINKRIPAEAGLAGGSSNAATTLRALNQLWNLNLGTDVLHQVAASLGSDINFFVEGCRAAVCRGRGEIIEPIPSRGPLFFVVARPTTGNSTPAVFRGLTPAESLYGSDHVIDALGHGSAASLSRLVFNRLTGSARLLNSEMSRLMEQMQSLAGRPVFMSGSGSTCFVIAESRRDAQRLLACFSALDTSFTALLRT